MEAHNAAPAIASAVPASGPAARAGLAGRGLLLTVLAAFLAGALLAAYLAWAYVAPQRPAELAKRAPMAADVPAPQSLSPPAPTPLATAAAAAAKQAEDAVERVAEQQGGLDQRLAAAEQRLARLDLQAQAAAGNAARAEGLLIAFATRRALERGAQLGYLSDQLRLRFGDQWPNAVATITDFSAKPIRLDSLIARLEGLGPQLRRSGAGPSWQAFQRELGQLFVFRRRSTPSPQSERRLERARWALEQGRYQTAIDEVKAMPGAARAQEWITDTERYAKAMAALEVIETAAVLDQRGLRDGAGNPVRELSSPLVRP